MAEISENASVNIEINSESAKRKIAELESKLTSLNQKKAEFERSGDTAGLVRVEKEIAKVGRQLNNARTNAQKCAAAMQRLSESSPKELRMVLRQLQNDLNHIERGSAAWQAHVETIKRVKAEIKAVDDELHEHEGLLSRVGRGLKDWGMALAGGFASISGLMSASRQAVEAYASMEAEMANTRKFTGMTADEVEHLNEEFKKIDTRTSREDLNKLAQEAGRLGLQSEQDVMGFVRAADQINVALDDLGEGATLTLSKLTDIFGDRERLGTEQSLLAVGSVINELSQNCTASAPYLANFAQRLAGVGKQANMTIPQIMGFAAVLDSQGQAVEMSATALSQLIMKLFQDPAKIAKATGMDLQAFNKVLKEDTNEALLMLLERLNSLGNISVLAPVFDAMGTDGARASAVIAALAGNIDMVKKQQQAANVAFKEGTSITKEFAVQNNTVQAELDKAKKGFHEMAVELGEKLAPAMKYAITGTSAMMRVLSGTVSFLSKYAATIISTAAVFGIYTVAVNAAVIADKLKVFWSEKVISSLKSLWKTLATNPWGAVAVAIGAVIGLLIDFNRRTNAAVEAQKALNDVQSQAAAKCVEQQQHIETLMAAAANLNLTYDEQLRAVAELNKTIPDFNGKINATTREFTYSTDALKAYNDQLARMYEIQGAKELLKDLGRERAELAAQRAATEAAIERERKNVSTTPTPQTSGGANVPSGVHAAMGHSATLSALQMELNETNNKLDVNAKKTEALTNAYGEDMQRQTVAQPPAQPTPPAPPTTTPAPVDEKEEKQRAAEAAKQARIAAALQKKEFKDALKAAEKSLNEQNAASLAAYNSDEITYGEYLDRKHAAQLEYYDTALAVYAKFGAEESADAAKLREKQAEAQTKWEEERIKQLTDHFAQERDLKKIAAQMEFYNPDNTEAYKNQRVLDDKLAAIDLQYHRDVLAAQKADSEGQAKAEMELNKATKQEELRQRKQMEADLSAWLYIYSQQGARQRMDAELAVVDELHKQEKLKTEEVEEAKAAIRKKYRDEVNSKTGTKAPNQDFADAKDDYEKQLKALEADRKQDLIEQEDYESRRWQIVQNYHNKVMQLISGQGSEWATMVSNLVETWKAGFEDLGSTLPEKLKSIADMAAAAFAVMNAGIKAYTDYATASRDLEVAEVEKSYDAQITAAGNNEKKRKKLEEQKQKDIAAIKTKYDKRAMAMEMAQAVASTAMAAINAYASAAKIPTVGFVMAPIAAAMATAAGMLQIATIKKSHQVQQKGYYEGGFTGRDGNNRREVGVVHANEFVANHQAVANPELLPVLRLIDHAQRNNTVGSLTGEDVSRALGQGTILGDMTAAQQRTAARGDRSMQLVAASMEQQTAAINELNTRLADGIESFMVMDGERGFDRYWQRYQRMKNNPTR